MAKQNTPAVQSGAAPVSPAGQTKQQISFRFGTLERSTPLSQLGPYWGSNGISSSTLNIGGQVQGDGYLYQIRLDVALTGGNDNTTLAVPFEDAPYSLFDTVGLKDSRADLVSSMNGFHLEIINQGQGNNRGLPITAMPSQTIFGETVLVNQAQTSGTGPFGSVSDIDGQGNGHFILDIPVGLNLKTLAAIVGNQDANSRYTLSLILASGAAGASGPFFVTAPAGGSAPTIYVSPQYRSFQVPPASIGGTPVQQTPPGYGKLHLINAVQPQNAPANNGNVSHFLSLNKVTIRTLAFVFRSGNSTNAPLRNGSTGAELNPPTTLRLFWGATETFEESWSMRKAMNFERLGFIPAAGVVYYDGMSDMVPGVGVESGASYIDTRALTSAKLQVSYPSTSGTWSSTSTLTVVQDALQVVVPG